MTRAARSFSPELRRELAAGARIQLAHRSLFAFMQEAWSVIEPGNDPDWNWHIEALCFHIQSMLEGWLVANGHAPADGTTAQKEIRARVIATWEFHGLRFREGQLLVQNGIANLAPGTLKSRILMVCAPAWMWLHCPTWTVCAISSVDDNVRRDSNDHKELVESEWYRSTFDVTWTIDPRRNSVGDWRTTAGGERKSRTLLGGFTGVHVDALFLDDPDDAHKVHNESARKEVQWKWRRAIKNRVKHLNRSIRFALQQRVHVDDWTAAQVAKSIWSTSDRKGWMWLSWPLRFGRGPSDAPKVSPFNWSDPRTVANDNLHPARFPDEVIADEMRERGPDGFAAQYDQNPETLDGGWIKRSYVRFFRIEDQPVSDRARPHGCGYELDADGKPTGKPEPAFVLQIDPRTKRPALDFLAITIDCSNGSEADDASAVGLLAVGGKGMQRFVLDDRTRVMGPHTMRIEIAKMVGDWAPSVVLVELAAMGKSSVADLRLALEQGKIKGPDGRTVIVKVVEVPTGSDSKEQRAQAMIGAWAAGLVYVLDGAAWLYPTVGDGGKTLDPGFIGEITGFPKVKKNDRVDAMSQAMTHFRESMSNRARWEIMAR